MFHDWRFQNLQLCVLRQTAHNTYNTYLTIIILFTTISFWRIMLSPRRKDWIRNIDVYAGETQDDAIMRELKTGDIGLCVYVKC